MTLKNDSEKEASQTQEKSEAQVEEVSKQQQEQQPQSPPQNHYQFQTPLPPKHYLFEGLPPPVPVQVPNCPSILQASKKRDWLPVKWKRLHPVYKTQGVCVEPRQGHRAVAYKHLMITFSGGNEELFNDLNVYNTTTNEWFQPNVKGQIPPPRAAYGAAIDGHRILMFGGMEEGVTFVDSLYELNVQKWEWTLLDPSCFGRTPFERPCSRIGHSFTLIKDRIFMFGGLSMEKELGENGYFSVPNYLNELHVLHARLNKQHGVWELPITFGSPPSRRESHTAVAYASKDLSHHKLVIFGGMLGYRLGDLFTLDVETMVWTEIRSKNLVPRSLHTATLIGDKIYIFGGWVPVATPPEEERIGIIRCDVSDMLSCFNVRTSSWEPVRHVGSGADSDIPMPRAGHSAVVINNRVYVWSGRYGFQRKEDGKQICLDDFWMLDVEKPGTPGKVVLLAAGHESLIVGWSPVPGADGYILQCKAFDMPEGESSASSSTVKNAVAPPPPPSVPPAGLVQQGQWRHFMTLPSRSIPPSPRLFQGPNGQLAPNRMMIQRFFGPSQPPQLTNQRSGGLLPPRPPQMQLVGIGGAPPMHPQILRRAPLLPIIPATVAPPSSSHPPSVAPQFNFNVVRPQMSMSRKDVADVMKAFLVAQKQQRVPGSLNLKQLSQVPGQLQDARVASVVLPTTKSNDQSNGNPSTSQVNPTSTPTKPMTSAVPTLQLVTPNMQPQGIPQQLPRQLLRLVQVPNSTPQRPPGNYVRILTPGQSQVSQQATPRLTLTGHGIPGGTASAPQTQPPPHHQQ